MTSVSCGIGHMTPPRWVTCCRNEKLKVTIGFLSPRHLLLHLPFFVRSTCRHGNGMEPISYQWCSGDRRTDWRRWPGITCRLLLMNSWFPFLGSRVSQPFPGIWKFLNEGAVISFVSPSLRGGGDKTVYLTGSQHLRSEANNTKHQTPAG